VSIYGFVEDLYIPQFRRIVGDAIDSIDTNLIEINAGKSYLINRVAEITLADVLIFMDSDIIVDSKSIAELVSCFEVGVFDVLVPNQKEDCRHRLSNLPQTAVVNGTQVKYSNRYVPFGISGGMFITKRQTILENRFDYVSEYGPDDTLFVKKLYDSGKTIGVLESVFVTHPFEFDADYARYKTERLASFFKVWGEAEPHPLGETKR
jgi:glycosyltransferase involved in cell wall biosynthesis